MRRHDWTSTPLGSPGACPAPLRFAVSILLNTHHPTFLYRGPEYRCFYNDARAKTKPAAPCCW